MNNRTVFDFTENEFKQWAQNKNFSAFANVMSGLNFSANKIMFTVLTKNITNFQKVENIANMTALETEYPGGAKNLEGVIYSNIKDFVTGTNLPLLQGKGDTGKRLNTTPAAARYNFVRIHDNFLKLLNKDDLKVTPRYFFEGKDIEYQYMPFLLPMILINGSEGIGSGHAQKILPRHPESIRKYLKARLQDKKLDSSLMIPYYNGFKGTVTDGENKNQYIIAGVIKRVSGTKTELTEVTPNYNYKSLIAAFDKLVDSGKIKSYDDLCDPKTDTFHLVVKHSDFSKMSDEEILKLFKQITTVTENLTAIDNKNRVILFSSPEELFEYYYTNMLEIIAKRKQHILDNMRSDIILDLSRYSFIKNITEEKIIISKRTKADIISQLEHFDDIVTSDGTYDYLLRTPVYSLTVEKMQELLDKIKKAKEALNVLLETSEKALWLQEI
jgi:DNA topoisomerase-2